MRTCPSLECPIRRLCVPVRERVRRLPAGRLLDCTGLVDGAARGREGSPVQQNPQVCGIVAVHVTRYSLQHNICV